MARVRSLPDEWDGDRLAAVVNGAFTAAFERCRPAPGRIPDLAARAASRACSVLVTADVVASVITGEPHDGEASVRAEAEMMVFRDLVEEHGLLPAEVHGMIASAETPYRQ